ncbi:carbonic anhydrase [Desulfosporosinus sp. FKB]|uniref:carbonic anhydrase n=1 Tax=Desulfosporosinus sp. FKB TaxID=1969835 RepID=UPI000B4A489C|nr:carbonic anhydrase [Desulfosporosinus sp. FKB]
MNRSSSYICVTLLGLLILLSGCHRSSFPTPAIPSADTNSASVQATSGIPVYQRKEKVTTPEAAMELLLEGNQRFKSGTVLNKDISITRRTDLLRNGQHPFAVIVSCSDSRVPPEMLFDQALGDLFVIRVAGNVITPVELGSVEYAVEHLKVPLVVVLGHESCGAVTAAVEGGETKGSISAVIAKIIPSVIQAKSENLAGNPLIEQCVNLNIQSSVQDLKKSPILKEALEKKQLQIIGSKYDLDEGGVAILS